MSKAALSVEMPLGAGAMRLLSDERLVRRAVEGDERAFAAIYRRYHQDLYRFSLAIVGNPEDAQDALQATMVKAMRALPGERREIQLKPWLYRIAHNESIELLRRRRAADPLASELPASTPQPHEEAEQRARLRTLLTDLEELPDRQRGALVMRELSGLGFEEIAGALKATPAVVRQAIYEARTSLRQMEEGRELGCGSVTLALSDADGRVTRRRDLRAHLRACPSCRRFRDELGQRQAGFAAIGPLPAIAAAGILEGVVGAKGAAGSLAGSLSGGLGGVFGSSVAVKSAATVAVVAAIGASVADREGLVDLGLPGGGHGGGAESGESAAASGGQVVTGAASLVAAANRPGQDGTGRGRGTARVRAGSGSRGDGANDDGAATGTVTQSASETPTAAAGASAATVHSRSSGGSGSKGGAGRGQGGELPEASDFGQQTATEKKGGAQAPGQTGEHPEQSQKPDTAGPPDGPPGQSGAPGASGAGEGGPTGGGPPQGETPPPHPDPPGAPPAQAAGK